MIGFVVLSLAYMVLATILEGRDKAQSQGWLLLPHVDTRVVERSVLVDAVVGMLLNVPVQRSTAIVALHGAGGFGKTTLALLAAGQRQIVRHFRGGIVWVTLGQDCRAAELSARLNDVSEQLTGIRPSLLDPIQAGLRLGQALQERKPTLLILDDVWVFEQMEPFLVGGSKTVRLVTTRVPAVLPADAALLRVDVMDHGEAHRLLTWQHPLRDADASTIIGIAGAWPLLLALLNSGLRRAVASGLTPDAAVIRIIDRLRRQGPAAFDLTSDRRRSSAVSVTVEASLALLEPVQRSQYLDLAVFPEDSEIPRQALGMLWDLDEAQVERLCDEFASMSLVMQHRADRGSIQLHDVLLAYLRSVIGAENLRAAHERLLAGGARHLLVDSRKWWQMPADGDYLWRYLFHHLTGAERYSEAAELLCDLRWIERRLELYGPAGAESDLSYGDDPIHVSLRQKITQLAHLLTATDPAAAVADILRTRIEDSEDLQPLVTAARHRTSIGRLETIWPLPDMPSSALRRVISGHSEPLIGCASSPDGAWLALYGAHGTVWVRDTSSWSVIANVHGHTEAVRGCAISPDRDWMVTVGDDGALIVWSTTTWQIKNQLRATRGTFTSCTLSPDGLRLVTTQTDHTATIWDSTRWDPIHRLSGHGAIVNSCAVSPDGAWTVTTSSDRTSRLWDLATGQLTAVQHWHRGAVTACGISPDGRWLATGGNDRRIRVLDLASNQTVLGMTAHGGAITSCAFIPGSSWLVTTSNDGTARVFTPAAQTRWETLRGHEGRVTGSAIIHNGQDLATVGQDRCLRIWQPQAPRSITALRPRRRPTGCTAVAIAPDGLRLLAATTKHAVMWDINPRSERVIIASPNKHITSCAIAPDGRWLVTTGSDGACQRWETPAAGYLDPRLSDGRVSLDPRQADSRSSRQQRTDAHESTITFQHDRHTTVTGCEIAPDGSTVATTCTDGLVRLWKVGQSRPTLLLKGHTGPSTSCAFSPDNQLLASAGHDGVLRLWNTHTGEQRHAFHGHIGTIADCRFSITGEQLITVGHDHTVRIWHRDGRLLNTLTGHTAPIHGCAVSASGHAATIDRGGVLRIWHLNDATCITMWRADGPLHTCSFHNDTIALGGSKGIYLLKLLTA